MAERTAVGLLRGRWGLAALCAIYVVAMSVSVVATISGADLAPVAGPAMTLFAVLSTALGVRAATDRRLDRRARSAWWWIVAAFGIQVVSFVMFAVHDLGERAGTFPSPGDYLRQVFLMVMLVGLLRLGGRSTTREQSFKVALDLAMVLTGGAMLLWYLVLGPVLAVRGQAAHVTAVAAAYPILDLALIAGGLIVTRRAEVSTRRPALLLAVAMLLMVIGDVYLSYQFANLNTNDHHGWQFLCWLTACFLLAVAANVQRRHRQRAVEDRPARSRLRLTYLPYAGVGLGYAMLAVVAVEQPFYPYGGLALGALVATALVIARQILTLRENRRLVVTDSLTGLANRVLLRDRLGREVDRYQRTGRPFAVLLLDLNGFKEINDSFGHEAGDATLVAVAHALRNSVSAADTAARLGGDEFAVILPDCDLAGAAAAADRISAAIAAPIVVAGHEVVPAASIGAAVSGPDCQTVRDLLHHADTEMYRVKIERRAGRPIRQPVVAVG